MRKLFIDIETSPILAQVWSLREQMIGINQIVRPSRVICAAWAFDEGPVKTVAEWQESIVPVLHDLLNEADVVVHFNGRSFDVPNLNREFIQAELRPPSTYAQVDLYRSVRSQFYFPSNKLAYVSQALLDSEKIKVDMDLWTAVMDGDEKARQAMLKYNKRDVDLTRKLYKLLLPWIDRHPNTGLYVGDGRPRCTACGSEDVQSRGLAYTQAGQYQRFQCKNCGRWLRGSKRNVTTPLREAL